MVFNMKPGEDQKTLRSFGLLVGGVFSVIGMWPLVLHGKEPRLWALALGILLILFGVAYPRALTHVYRAWMKIGHVLGWINTRIILGVIFFGLFTPMGLVMRMFGKDSMRRALIQGTDTYRVLRSPRSPVHLKRQF